jgi:hypothetical protein
MNDVMTTESMDSERPGGLVSDGSTEATTEVEPEASSTAADAHDSEEDGPAYGLRWGLKRTFIDYLRGMSDGRALIGSGATAINLHEVFYELAMDESIPSIQHAPGAAAQPLEMLAFGGEVHFSGHFGMLSVRISKPRLRLLKGTVELSIDAADTAGGIREVPLVTAGELTLATVVDDMSLWVCTDVRLTAHGAELFNRVYGEGEPFEPMVVQLPSWIDVARG